MSQEEQVQRDVMMNSVVTKVEKEIEKNQEQAKKLSKLEGEFKALADHSKEWRDIKMSIQELMTISKGHNDIMQKLGRFSVHLDLVISLLRHPTESKVQHHHHFPKIAWITAGLFLAFCLVCAGWYMTAHDADQYRANDIKYRELKLEEDSAFQNRLWQLDSIYQADAEKLERAVKEMESLRRKSLELTDQLQAVNRKIGQDKKTGQSPKKGKKQAQQ